MKSTIHTIRLGFTNTFVIREKGVIMIDAGGVNSDRDFLKGLGDTGIAPDQIRLLILTHGHWDHIGGAAKIQRLTGAKVWMHRNDAPCLESSATKAPPGITVWGRLTAALFRWMPRRLVHVPPAGVDRVLGDEGCALEEFGVSGKVLFTPGHSSGSVSVLLDGGEGFVGDMAMSGLPLRLSAGLPIYAENQAELVRSWHGLLAQGIQTVFPSHGRPFDAGIMARALGCPQGTVTGTRL